MGSKQSFVSKGVAPAPYHNFVKAPNIYQLYYSSVCISKGILIVKGKIAADAYSIYSGTLSFIVVRVDILDI